MTRVIGVFVLIGLILLVITAAYVVNETEQVIITQFGKPIDSAVTSPGLKFKLPFIQKINRFEKRFLAWDGEVNELTTRDKRFIIVDTYARWRIVDPLLFFKRLRDERGAQTRLDDILDGETRNSIAKHDLVEIVRTSNREPARDESLAEDEGDLDPIAAGREVIRQEILANAQARAQDLGIEILDLQFKRLNYNEDVRRKVYERMISERQRIATRYRSEGDGEASRISGEKERELKRIQSEAYRTAQEIKGRADAEATQVYADAYNQSSDSRDFYAFIKTLETYRLTVDDRTTLILSTDGALYRLMKEGGR